MDASIRLILAVIAVSLLAAAILIVGVPTWLGRRERTERPERPARRGHRSSLTYVDEAHTMSEADVDELLAVLRDNSTRLPESREAARQRHRKVLDDINATPPGRLRGPWPYAKGGVIPPRRLSDSSSTTPPTEGAQHDDR